MWPTITEAPTAPGRGLPVYQPATEAMAGTCRAPEGVSLRRTSPLRTPMDGMMRPVGAGTLCILGSGAPAVPAGQPALAAGPVCRPAPAPKPPDPQSPRPQSHPPSLSYSLFLLKQKTAQDK